MQPSATAPTPTMTPPAFHVMVKPGGAICNLDCSYCYFLSKELLYPGSRFRMAYETLEAYTQQYIEAQRAPEVTFAWQGGEPTRLGLGFYRVALGLQAKYRRPGMVIGNTLQTNDTLLDDEWCAFFKEHDFLFGLSLDGPEKLHDACRVDKARRGSFARVMKGLRLLQRHGVELNVLTTVHAANAPYPVEVYRFLRDEAGARFMQFIPMVGRDNATGFHEGTAVTARSVTGRAFGAFMRAFFDEWLRRDVGEVFVQLFDVTLSSHLGLGAGLCVFEETCGKVLGVEHTGDVYSCDHYVEPDYLFGNLLELPLAQMVGSERQRAFGAAKRDTLLRYCLECEVRFACNGGYPNDRILMTPDGELGLNYLCAGYRAFFNHVDEPMRRMAAALRRGEDARVVMEQCRAQALSRTGRNAACPCGSGKKAKHCCQRPGARA